MKFDTHQPPSKIKTVYPPSYFADYSPILILIFCSIQVQTELTCSNSYKKVLNIFAAGADFEAVGLHPFVIVNLWKCWTLHRGPYPTKEGQDHWKCILVENFQFAVLKMLKFFKVEPATKASEGILYFVSNAQWYQNSLYLLS